MNAKPGWACIHGTCKRVHDWGTLFCWQHEKIKIKQGKTRAARASRRRGDKQP